MALLGWWPLNGTLENKGSGNFTNKQINGEISVNDDGKIGKCYLFTDPSSIVVDTNIENLTTDLTITFWVKFNTTQANTCIVCCRSLLGSGISVFTIGSNFRFDTGASQTTFTNYARQNGEWHHFAFVKSSSKKSLYVDGQFIESHADTTPITSLSNILSIGASQINNSSFDNYFGGYLNDLRIHDECLSKKQIKEIYKSLYLHYPMNKPNGIIGGRNFILTSNQITSGGNASGITSSYESNGILKIIAAVGNSNYRSIGFLNNSASLVGENLHKGDPYTISFDLCIEAGSGIPKLFINSGNSYASMTGNSTLLGCWQRVYRTGIWNEPGTGYGNIALHLGFSGLAGTYYVKNFKLEKGHNSNCYWSPAPEDSTVFGFDPIIYDSSEYENNGFVTFDSRNLISPTLVAGGQTTLNGNYSVITSGTNADTYFYCNTTEPVNTSDYYEFSYDIACATEIPEDWVFGVNGWNLGNDIPIKGGHQKIIFKFDAVKSRFILDDAGSRPNPTPVVTITNVSLRRLGSAPAWSEEAPLGYGSYKFNGYNYIDCGLTPKLKEFTINFWIKSASLAQGKCIVCCADYGGWEIYPLNSTNLTFTAYCGSSYRHITIAPLSGLNDDNFHMLSISYCVDEVKTYVDGQLTNTVNMASFEEITYNSTNHLFLGGEAEGLNCIPKYIGLLNDFRIYATVLSAEDIKELYQTRFQIDNTSNIYLNSFEEFGENLIEETNKAIATKTWGNGLYNYTQSHCQVTFVDGGVRVYRTPGKSQGVDGNVMWGGIKLRIQDKLKEGHSYILMYHAKGRSNNGMASPSFTNNMGWTSTELCAQPTNVSLIKTPTNFDGELEGYYKFTISDTLYKTCTSSYSSFVAGESYPAYRDFQLRWDYTNTGTGEIGTDIIFSNFRLYDISAFSNEMNTGFNKSGILSALSINEDSDQNFEIGRLNYITGNKLIEL